MHVRLSALPSALVRGGALPLGLTVPPADLVSATFLEQSVTCHSLATSLEGAAQVMIAPKRILAVSLGARVA